MTNLSCWRARGARGPCIVSGLLGVGLALAPAACGSVAATQDGLDASFGPGTHKEGGSPDTGRLGSGSGCGASGVGAGCACTEGEQRTCYTGAAGTAGVGGCKAGVETCVRFQESQLAFGPCVGEVIPGGADGQCVVDAARPREASLVDAGHDAGLPDATQRDAPRDSAHSPADVTTSRDGGGGSDARTAGSSVVLFGGWAASEELADTWTWDGAVWTQRSVVGPSERSGTVMAPLGGALVLFGGFGPVDAGPSVLGDTWTWDGTAWSQLEVSGPPAREFAAMAPLGGEVVLFGGLSGDGAVYLGDTWTWDGATWTPLAVSGPPARGRAVMAPLGDKLVLFGGESADGWLSDTWTWDGAAWTQLSVTGPAERLDPMMAPLGGALVLFGGFGLVGPSESVLGDTWTWDGSMWSDSAPPGLRRARPRWWPRSTARSCSSGARRARRNPSTTRGRGTARRGPRSAPPGLRRAAAPRWPRVDTR